MLIHSILQRKTSASTSKITSNCWISFYEAEEMRYLCASLSSLETDMHVLRDVRMPVPCLSLKQLKVVKRRLEFAFFDAVDDLHYLVIHGSRA